MLEMAIQIFEDAGFADQGWEVESGETLICPDGEVIEWDGSCSCHGASPMIQMGII